MTTTLILIISGLILTFAASLSILVRQFLKIRNGGKNNGWLTEKPTYWKECLLITADKYDNGLWYYKTFRVDWALGDGEDGIPGYYWALSDAEDGEDCGDINDLRADKYLMLPLLEERRNTNF